MSGRVRIIAQSPGDVFVVCEGDELPTGPYDARLYLPVRRYDLRLDTLTEPVWLGSALKFLGGYLAEPSLDANDEQRVLSRVAALLA